MVSELFDPLPEFDDVSLDRVDAHFRKELGHFLDTVGGYLPDYSPEPPPYLEDSLTDFVAKPRVNQEHTKKDELFLLPAPGLERVQGSTIRDSDDNAFLKNPANDTEEFKLPEDHTAELPSVNGFDDLASLGEDPLKPGLYELFQLPSEDDDEYVVVDKNPGSEGPSGLDNERFELVSECTPPEAPALETLAAQKSAASLVEAPLKPAKDTMDGMITIPLEWLIRPNMLHLRHGFLPLMPSPFTPPPCTYVPTGQKRRNRPDKIGPYKRKCPSTL